MLELYASEPNTFFLKPLIALAEKRAPFTLHYVDAANLGQFAPGLPADLESTLRLEREGPLLVDGDTVISGTSFMLEYLSEALPGPALLPAGAYDCYRVRAWAQYLGAQLGSSVPVLGCAKYLQPHLATLPGIDQRIAAGAQSLNHIPRGREDNHLMGGDVGDKHPAAARIDRQAAGPFHPSRGEFAKVLPIEREDEDCHSAGV